MIRDGRLLKAVAALVVIAGAALFGRQAVSALPAFSEWVKSLGYKAPERNSMVHAFVLGKTRTFDPSKPEEYLRTFAIRRA